MQIHVTKKLAIFFLLLLFLTNNSNSQNLDSLLKVVSKEKSANAKVEIWLQVAYIYLVQKNDAGFQNAAQQILHLAIELKNDTLISGIYSSLGSYYEDKANFNSAIEYHIKSLKIVEKLNYKAGIAIASEQIAVVYKNLKNINESVKYLRKAEICLTDPELKNSVMPRAVYANLAETYLLAGLTDSALHCVQIAENVTQKESDPFGYSRVLLIYGMAYSKKGDNELSETYFKKGIKFSDTAKQTQNLVTTLYEYSRYLLKKGNIDSAKKYAQLSLAENKKISNSVLTIEISDILREVFNNLKRYDSAYYYSNLKDFYKDSIYNQKSLYSIQEMTFSQKIHETEEEIKKQEVEEKRKHSLQYILIGIGLITFVILFLVISYSILFNAKLINFFGVVGLLLVFEFINLLLHPFLESITSHSPVLIFLTLVGIAGLLVPLHHRLEKWVTNKMTEKNNKIRLAAAKKIIENLEGKKI